MEIHGRNHSFIVYNEEQAGEQSDTQLPVVVRLSIRLEHRAFKAVYADQIDDGGLDDGLGHPPEKHEFVVAKTSLPFVVKMRYNLFEYITIHYVGRVQIIVCNGSENTWE